jgi:hypothetical protein
MSDFKDLLVEWRYREVAALSLTGLICDAAVLPREEHERLIVDAFDRGLLSLSERDDAILADVVVRGQRCDNGSPVLLVIEVAPEIGTADVEQALCRAAIWAKLGVPTQPAVAGLRLSAAAEQAARHQPILVSVLPELLNPAAVRLPSQADALRPKGK